VVGEHDAAGRDERSQYCPGSGTVPSRHQQSLGSAAANWGWCSVCEGSYRVDREGLLVEHRRAR
jgi:hypothetical protein